MVFLTFDDGPVPEVTPRVLDLLDELGVKATFFMVGDNVRRHPELLEEVRRRGHGVGNHTMHHLQGMRTRGVSYLRDVAEADALIGSRLFRPPHGEYNSNIASLSRSEGMEVVMWSATYHDSTGKYTEKQIMKLATTGNDYTPGTIVLCHVNGYYQPNSLDAGLTHYESLGLQVVPISALIYASGRELPAMPEGEEALVYTNEYWENWLANNLPEYAPQPAEEATAEAAAE